jgi:predicted enzyme related to lactoylglutathione lyase
MKKAPCPPASGAPERRTSGFRLQCTPGEFFLTLRAVSCDTVVVERAVHDLFAERDPNDRCRRMHLHASSAAMSDKNTGRFVWHENLTKDPKAAIAFYSEVVGWKTQPFGNGSDYVMWVGAQGPLGGVMKLPDEAAKMGVPPHWMGNVGVDDVDAACAQVKKLGGKIHKEPSDIPTVGRFAVIGDPQGASIAVFKAAQTMNLHDNQKEGEICWNELMTSDSQAAFQFYSQLFGWKILTEMDMGPMGTYRVFGIGDTRIGGMMTIPKGTPMPTAWLYYAQTNNLDAATDRAKKQGAKIMNGPMDVPEGRVVQFMDTQGAAFALHMAVPKK